jgi:glc operon protein GlcG
VRRVSAHELSIAILDDGAPLLGFHRMDGCPPSAAKVSIGKATTSALTYRPSKFFEDRVKERPAFVTFPAGTLTQGALPIMHQVRRRDRRRSML